MGRNMHKELEPLGGVDTPKLSDFWDWVKKTFTPSYQTEVEKFLSESVDIKDLESRMSVVQRRGFL